MLRHEEVERIIRSIVGLRVLVVGDLMLDEYLWGRVERISPEAPVPVMNLYQSERSLGGAANVARNVVSLGARVIVVGVVGTDDAAASLIDELDRAGIDRSGVLTDPGRTTTRKCRLMSLEHHRQVFRFDQEMQQEVSPAVEDFLLALVQKHILTAQVVICSDYLKGVLTQRVLQETAAIATEHDVPLITAPKDVSPAKYVGASVLMPNLQEFAGLAGHRMNGSATSWIDQAAWSLSETYGFSAFLVTRGPEGMTLFERENGNLRRRDISSLTRSVYDVTGAGDTALSMFSLAVAAGADRVHAAYIANIAAGVVVGKRGTAGATTEEILTVLNGDGQNKPSVPDFCHPNPLRASGV